jgi:hypothetical protein
VRAVEIGDASPQRNSPAIASAGRSARQNSRNPAAVIARDVHSSGAVRLTRRVSKAPPMRAAEDAEIEGANRGGGVGGAQSCGAEQFSAEVDDGPLGRDADPDEGGY